MRLVHHDLHIQIDIDENRFPVLIMERSELFYSTVFQILQQSEGLSGPFVLSDNWEPLDFGKSVLVVTDLFNLELNGRRQSTALNKYLNTLAVNEEHIQATLLVQNQITNWVIDIENDLPFPTVHNNTLDIGSIIKLAGIRFDDSAINLAEKLCSFIKICAGFLKIRLLVFAGLHTVLGEEELNLLYKNAMYEKIAILCLERYALEKKLFCEKLYIIDSDNCEIYNDSDDDIP